MSEPSPIERVERAIELAATSTVRIEQNVQIPSRAELQSAVLTGQIERGVATGLALEGGGESLGFWIESGRGAIDLRPVGDEALTAKLDAVGLGVVAID